MATQQETVHRPTPAGPVPGRTKDASRWESQAAGAKGAVRLSTA